MQTYHEVDGEYLGHLRISNQPVEIVNSFLMPVRLDNTPRTSNRQAVSGGSASERAPDDEAKVD